LWALWRSTWWGRNLSDVGFGARFFGLLSVAILLVGFTELQPLLLDGMFKIAHAGAGEFSASVSAALKWIAGVFASIGTVVGFLGRFLADTLKRTTEKPGFTAFATRIAIKLAMYLAGAAVPIVLWVVYLYLSFWGIADLECAPKPCTNNAPAWLQVIADEAPLAR